MKLLIAEDNPINQMINEHMMEHWGYDFDMANNGREAVALAQANNGQYDLCLMDVEMPEMNGIETTRIIRKAVSYFPILGLTANDDYRRACFEAGMDDFVVKPCRPEELSARICELAVKSRKVITQDGSFDIEEVMPVDKKHADELRELDGQGLCKMNIRGVGNHDLILNP